MLSHLLSLSRVTPFSLILPYVSSGEKRDVNFNSVALASLVPPSVLHGVMTWGYPFHLAASPQTLSRPTFPIHFLWETLGGTDQVAYNNLYNKHGSHSKRHPSRIQTLLGWNWLALLRMLYAHRSSPTHYCSNGTCLPINYPKCYLLKFSNSRQGYFHISMMVFAILCSFGTINFYYH